MIAHVVLFEPKKDSSPDDLVALLDALGVACREISGVQRAQVGKTVRLGVGYENVIGGSTYSYVAVMEFDDKSNLLSYLNHPLHEKLGQLFWKVCESTMIADVEMQDASSANVASLSSGKAS